MEGGTWPSFMACGHPCLLNGLWGWVGYLTRERVKCGGVISAFGVGLCNPLTWVTQKTPLEIHLTNVSNPFAGH